MYSSFSQLKISPSVSEIRFWGEGSEAVGRLNELVEKLRSSSSHGLPFIVAVTERPKSCLQLT